jgi:hypothetical protein
MYVCMYVCTYMYYMCTHTSHMYQRIRQIYVCNKCAMCTHVKGVGIQLCNYLIDKHSPKVSANGMDELTSPTRQSKASPPSIVVASIQRQID